MENRVENYEYTIEKYKQEYHVRIPYRALVWIGDTPELAIGSMLRGVAKLARDGSMDPDYPSKPGEPAIQHAISVLTEELSRHVSSRRDMIADEPFKLASQGASSDLASKPAFSRRNELVSGIATAIAALARVKEL